MTADNFAVAATSGAAGVLTPSPGSVELTVLDDARCVRWAVSIAAAAHDACLL